MRKIRIFTRKAYISLDYIKQDAYIYKKKGPLILKHALPIEREEPLKKELESFIECVRDNKSPIVTGQAARNALALALKIGQDIEKNRKFVFKHFEQK